MMGVLWRLFGPLHRACMSCQAPTSERHCESNRSCIHRSQTGPARRNVVGAQVWPLSWYAEQTKLGTLRFI